MGERGPEVERLLPIAARARRFEIFAIEELARAERRYDELTS
jgi:hypothetical protein